MSAAKQNGVVVEEESKKKRRTKSYVKQKKDSTNKEDEEVEEAALRDLEMLTPLEEDAGVEVIEVPKDRSDQEGEDDEELVAV